LNGLRALDLTNEGGFFCGKVLAHLGVDVIKVEKPGGDKSREIGPFYHDVWDPQRSLYWFSYNSNKKSITLNIEIEEGKRIFRKLANNSDFVIESFSPGYMDEMGLGYEDIRKINHKNIFVSISPFGQTGPYKSYEASDITLMAMSGLMSTTGDPDRSPVRLGLDMSYCLGGAHAAAGSMMALYNRNTSGEGQHVDISIYECLFVGNYREPVMWEYEKRLMQRIGNRFTRGATSTQQVWQCKDGYVTWTLIDQPKMCKALVECMDEEDLAGPLKFVNWETIHISELPEEQINEWERSIGDFFLKHTKKELEAISLKKNLTLAIVNDVGDVADSELLSSRGFWEELESPDLGDKIKSPSFLFLSSEPGSRLGLRASSLGEHNKQIYEKELGFSKQQISDLRKANVI